MHKNSHSKIFVQIFEALHPVERASIRAASRGGVRTRREGRENRYRRVVEHEKRDLRDPMERCGCLPVRPPVRNDHQAGRSGVGGGQLYTYLLL